MYIALSASACELIRLVGIGRALALLARPDVRKSNAEIVYVLCVCVQGWVTTQQGNGMGGRDATGVGFGRPSRQHIGGSSKRGGHRNHDFCWSRALTAMFPRQTWQCAAEQQKVQKMKPATRVSTTNGAAPSEQSDLAPPTEQSQLGKQSWLVTCTPLPCDGIVSSLPTST